MKRLQFVQFFCGKDDYKQDRRYCHSYFYLDNFIFFFFLEILEKICILLIQLDSGFKVYCGFLYLLDGINDSKFILFLEDGGILFVYCGSVN